MPYVQVGEIDRPDHKELRGDRGITCTQRAKTAFIMGFCIGATIGGFYGGAAAFRTKLAGREFARVVGKNILNIGGSFGGFMSIGSFLRCY